MEPTPSCDVTNEAPHSMHWYFIPESHFGSPLPDEDDERDRLRWDLDYDIDQANEALEKGIVTGKWAKLLKQQVLIWELKLSSL